MEELEAFVRLLHLPGFGAVRIRKLVERFGSAAAAFSEDPSDLAENTTWKQRWSFSQWEKDMDLIYKENVTLLPFTDPRYPRRLRDISDPPILLYIKGQILPCDGQGIAIIGTRFATPYGLEAAQSFAEELAKSNTTIISGLARGIDTAAHAAALKFGRTIAVIGSGLARLYPPENRLLAEKIASAGAIISEFPMDTPPDKQTFPQRNRIVSGLSRSVLLIEAPEKSGAMITMELARAQGRQCWAIPARLDYTSFNGNHKLMKEGAAQLATSPRDLIAGADDLFGGAALQNHPPKVLLSAEEVALFDLLPVDCVTLDELCNIAKLPVTKLSVLLMGLVLKNLINEYPGKRYQKKINLCQKH